MSITDFLDAVTALVPDYSFVYGTNPPSNGYCIIPSGGFPPGTHFDKGQVIQMDVLINGKNVDQEAVNEGLWDIHKKLSKVQSILYPNEDDWQIMDISTISFPSLLGQEQGTEQWIYGSSMQIKFYWKGVHT